MEREKLRLKAALPLALILAAAAALAFGLLQLWRGVDPASQLVIQLKDAERLGATLPIEGDHALVSRRLNYDRLDVELLDGGARAVVVSTLDFEGTLSGIQVHSLGYERVPFVREGRSYSTPEGLAPRLTAAVRALWARRRALQAGDRRALEALTQGAPDAGASGEALERVLGLKSRSYEVSGWYLRLERNSALVSEDYRLQGSAPDRPIDEEGTRRLELQPRNSGEFYFPHGLM